MVVIMLKYPRIVVPVDFQPLSRAALHEADTIAAAGNMKLVVVHVVDDAFARQTPGAQAQAVLDERTREAQASLVAWTNDLKTPADRVQAQVLQGTPVEVLLGIVDAQDLIVMPTHGRQGTTYFMMGSVAERVVRSAPCAVLVLKPGK